jgi:hypothetical protein
MQKSNIIVNLQVEGIHHWPECPIEEVSFLKFPHRHIFHIECKKAVTHLDRDVEIIELKREITLWLKKMYGNEKSVHDFNSMSCEMIAVRLIETFQLNYCKVLEDNENGAEIIIEL